MLTDAEQEVINFRRLQSVRVSVTIIARPNERWKSERAGLICVLHVCVLQWMRRWCGWLTDRVLTRAAWRCTTNAAGARCATTSGIKRTETWFAGCWDTKAPARFIRRDALDRVRSRSRHGSLLNRVLAAWDWPTIKPVTLRDASTTLTTASGSKPLGACRTCSAWTCL